MKPNVPINQSSSTSLYVFECVLVLVCVRAPGCICVCLPGRHVKRTGRETLKASSSTFINYGTEEGCVCQAEQMVCAPRFVCVRVSETG